MNFIPLLLIMTMIGVGGVSSVYAQTVINVTSTTPCFLNYTAGVEMWKNCGFQDDYIGASLVGFEWVMGGNFSMVIVGVLVLMTYIKYHTVLYPIAIGIVFLPVSYTLFPEIFLTMAIIMAGVGISAGIWWAFIRQTE